MVEATNERIYEVLKSMQARLDRMDDGIVEVKSELKAIRTHITGVGQDILNIY